jgi:hypothetical protein
MLAEKIFFKLRYFFDVFGWCAGDGCAAHCPLDPAIFGAIEPVDR